MPTPIDSLKIGDWIAVTGDKHVDDASPYYRPVPDYSGIPFEIVAISPPFIAVMPHGDFGVRSLDARRWDVQRVDKRYVEAYRKRAEGPMATPARRRQARRKKKREKPDLRDCPRCGERCVQRHHTPSNSWHLVCQQCGLDRGDVAAIGL